MNYHNQRHWVELDVCPVCGRDAGARKVTASIPEKFCVICGNCGFRTRFHTALNVVTREWNLKGR